MSNEILRMGVEGNIHSKEINTIEAPYQKARKAIESLLGTIKKSDVITGGLVSHVYKIKGEKETGIVKIRGTHLAKIPQIPIDPKDIDYEWTALQILSKLHPQTFPQPLILDRHASMILMSDIMPEATTLEQRLEAREVDPKEMVELGYTVANIHKKLALFNKSIRDGGDEKVYYSDLRRRLGYRENQQNIALENIFSQLSTRPKQLILGDLSPKNIGRGKDGQITICDVESFYKGNIEFPYGYLAGHILLHTIDDQNHSEISIRNLLNGYKLEDEKTDLNSMLLKKITLGAILYRLTSKLVPYNLSLSAEEKFRKATTAYRLLKEDRFTWSDLVRDMCKT